MRSQWLWLVSQVLAVSGLMATLVAPSYALVDLGGEVRFSLGQVLMLVALGAAGGDMRSKVNGLQDDVKRLRKDFEGGD